MRCAVVKFDHRHLLGDGVRIALIGFGRIGRAFARQVINSKTVQLVAVNELISDVSVLAYSLKYDSHYGRLEHDLEVSESGITISKQKVTFFSEENLLSIDWGGLGVDVLVDATGVHMNIEAGRQLVESGVIENYIVTHAGDGADTMVVLGTNEDDFNPKSQKVVSSGICDVIGTSPVLKILDEDYEIESGHIVTLHPWLSYQNLVDAPLLSTSVPGTTYSDYALGRASSSNLIPKSTSVVKAMRNLSHLQDRLTCMSFRVPTPTVASAHVSLSMKKNLSYKEVIASLNNRLEAGLNEKFPVLKLNAEALVSSDFIGDKSFTIFDERWLQINGKNVHYVNWYDNEYGYAYHLLCLTELIEERRRS